MSIGEDRVRVKFNPSESTTAGEIKQATARLIDAVNVLRSPSADRMGEHTRLKSLALTAYEEAAMWAVKAATMPEEEVDADE